MKRLILGLIAIAIAVPATAQVQVKGYTRSDGTYVQPHVRSTPNSSTYDNWSTKGNVNPYTGKQGTADPFALPSTPRYTPSAPAYQPYTPYTPPKAPCYFNCPK